MEVAGHRQTIPGLKTMLLENLCLSPGNEPPVLLEEKVYFSKNISSGGAGHWQTMLLSQDVGIFWTGTQIHEDPKAVRGVSGFKPNLRTSICRFKPL